MQYVSFDSLPESINDITLLLSGTTHESVRGLQLLVNGTVISFPTRETNTNWSAAVVLQAGYNELEIRAYDNEIGAGSRTLLGTAETTVTVSSIEPEDSSYYGDLDRWGLLVGIQRLPGEKNSNYRFRLLDAFRNPANSSLLGLTKGISRELSLGIVEEALTLTIAKGIDDQPLATGVIIYGTPGKLSILADQLVVEEWKQVKPESMSISLQYKPASRDFSIATADNTPLDANHFYWDKDAEIVRFRNTWLSKKWVKVRYKYVAEFDLSDITCAELVTAITAVKNGNNASYFSVSTTVPTYTAGGLFGVGGGFLAADQQYVASWSKIRLRELIDEDFRDSAINADGTYHNSKLEYWANAANVQTRITWGQTVLDVDYWDSIGNNRFPVHLQALWDNPVVRWYDGAGTTSFTALEFLRYGGRHPTTHFPLRRKGFTVEQFKSGISHGNSLYMNVAEVIES